MKTTKIFSLLSVLAALCFTSCVDEISYQNPYTRNVGEETLAVSADALEFPGRGSSLTFTVNCSYDATIQTPDWITVTSTEIPGDGREFTVTATAASNMAEGGSDRSDNIVISTKTLCHNILVSQPYYQRPACPTSISTVEDFRSFIEVCAPYYEEGETVEMASDIDLDGVTLACSAESFKGVLNGNNFKIKNWKAAAPLFAKNNGVINNLVMDASCTVTVPSSDVEIFFSPFVGKNYGTVAGCVNNADIVLDGDYARTNVGSFAACNYDTGVVTNCTNNGEIKFVAASGSTSVFIGGIVGYDYNKSSVTCCENYGPITCNPAAFSATYQLGGIVGHHNSSGDLAGNTVHKEAKMYTNNISGSSKSYIGGIVGNMDMAPKTSDNSMYADMEINLKVESYIGGLQGWQGKVDDASNPSQTEFEGSIVNTNITAYTKGKGTNGNNPCLSAGFVTGRFSGQSGKATTLHYGTADKPIQVSGSITSIQSGIKKVAAAKDYQAMLDGDGSKTSVNLGAIPECDYGNILYKVCGDGQTGDAEDLIVKTDKVKLAAPATGGDVTFTVRGNYTMTVTPEVDWITSDVETVAGDGEYHEITLTAAANGHTYTREGTVAISMPMGSTEIVTVTQDGNKTLPESLTLSTAALTADPAGMETTSFKVTTNYDSNITVSDEWISVNPATVPGDETEHTIVVTCAKNQSGAAREGYVTVTLEKGYSEKVTVSQEKFVYVPKAEIGTAADFLDFMTYGNDDALYNADFEVKLTADIDLKGMTVGSISTFAGVLDGQGHKLKNIKSDVPLFSINKGTVKNLVLDSSCSFALDPTKAPTSGSAIWTGALCGNVLTGGTFIDCTNKASVTMTAIPTMQTFIGGIAGRTNGDVTIEGCVNEGSIIIKPAGVVSGADVRIAGVVAGCNGAITNCVNNAPIEYSPADHNGKQFNLGGVTAYLDTKTMQGCVNKQKGTVTFNPTAYTGTAQAYVGGLLAYVNKKTTITNSKNFGDVKVTANQEKIAVGGLTGWINSGGAGFILFDGCEVNCNVTAVTPAAGATTSTNPLMSAGLVIGRVAVKNNADNVTCQIGTEEAPCKVAGSLVVSGGATVTADATNFTSYLFGNSMTSNFFNNGAYKMDATNVKYEAVTKE